MSAVEVVHELSENPSFFGMPSTENRYISLFRSGSMPSPRPHRVSMEAKVE